MSEPVRTARLREAAQLLARSLPPLLVEAEQLAMAFAPGVHGRRQSGQGETFWQFRRYAGGDPATSIDWRQSARTDHLFVREYEWEAAQSIYLWADASPSMRYASAEGLSSKAHRAALLGLGLGLLLVRAGERIGTLDGTVKPGNDRLTVRRVAEYMARRPAPGLGEVPDLPRGARSGHIILLSDFLTDLDRLDHQCARLASTGLRGHLVLVLDPAEEDLPFEGRAFFEDLEDPRTLTVGRVESLREGYAGALAAHKAQLGAIAARRGWTVTHHRTDEPAQRALLALHQRLSGAPLDEGLATVNPASREAKKPAGGEKRMALFPVAKAQTVRPAAAKAESAEEADTQTAAANTSDTEGRAS